MVVPVAAAQQISRSFKMTFVLSVVIGTAVALAGTVTSYYQDVPPGATIVLLAIVVFVVLTLLATPLARRRGRRSEAAPEECTLEVPASRPATDELRVRP
jgi:zinc transport system permease protein